MTSDIKTRAQILEILGKNLERILKEKGVTRKQLAENLGVGVDMIGDYINGKTLAPLDRIFMLADFLKVSIIDLTGNNGYAPAEIDVEKNIFEYRLQHALTLAEKSMYNPQILPNGKVIIYAPREIEHDNDGVIYSSPSKKYITFNDKAHFVDVMESTERYCAEMDFTFNEAITQYWNEWENTKNEKVKMTPNLERFYRGVEESKQRYDQHKQTKQS